MAATLDHTIVPATDKAASAAFLAGILGLDAPRPWGPFVMLSLGNGVSLDYIDHGGGPVDEHHYAFLVDEDEFDTMVERIRTGGVAHWADPGRRRPGEVNHDYGGRGLYFADPDGHLMEILTHPYV